MSDKKNNVLLENLALMADPDNFQKYVLGVKKNGQPRALYDIVKPFIEQDKKKNKNKKKKKKNKKDPDFSTYAFYVNTKKHKKKKKKNHWHI